MYILYNQNHFFFVYSNCEVKLKGALVPGLFTRAFFIAQNIAVLYLRRMAVMVILKPFNGLRKRERQHRFLLPGN
jgi:hypothetical protein